MVAFAGLADILSHGMRRAVVTGWVGRVSANIHEFGGTPSRPVGSHAATVTELEINGFK